MQWRGSGPVPPPRTIGCALSVAAGLQQGWGMAFTLAEAAKAIGRDKSTLARAVRTGRLSATRDADGVWRIDESELRRVYPVEMSAPGATVGATPGLRRSPWGMPQGLHRAS